ncbi:MAG: hypothetical protein AB1642_01295 [Pseudomonadota bacterium]
MRMKKQLAMLACAGMVAALASGAAIAEINKGTHLNTRGQSKVNKALAKGYMQSSDDGAKRLESQTQVNIGSRRAGTCTMNVGTQAAGSNSKEVIVTSKEIINICK